MKDNSLPRIIVIIVCATVFVAVLIVNALAGAGRGPFHSSTGNVSSRHETDITPAGWTFSIWGVIYTWLTLMVIYITSYVFRGSWAQCLLPYSFYFCWLSNMVMNMIWLLLWDRELMLAALVVLILIVFTNYSALFLCCYATDYYGPWLQTYHRKDLACLRLLVQNGLALYTTWTSIASLINFSLVLHLWGVDRSTAATASLCILFAEVVGWFILENWVLDRWVRYILTVYPVVIVALVGNILRHFNPADPTPNSVFMSEFDLTATTAGSLQPSPAPSLSQSLTDLRHRNTHKIWYEEKEFDSGHFCKRREVEGVRVGDVMSQKSE